MNWENRLSQMIEPTTGRSVILACVHDSFIGQINQLGNPMEMLKATMAIVNGNVSIRYALQIFNQKNKTRPHNFESLIHV